MSHCRRSYPAMPRPTYKSPVAALTDESYTDFVLAVVEHVCAIRPEMGNTAAGAVHDALAAHTHLLRFAPRPKES